MPPRSIGSATISFGLVSIPVRSYVATHSEQVSFHLLHAPCGTRIKQQTVCPRDAAEIETGAAVKARASETELARKLVAELSHDAFRPEQYQDHYRDRVEAVVCTKYQAPFCTQLARLGR